MEKSYRYYFGLYGVLSACGFGGVIALLSTDWVNSLFMLLFGFRSMFPVVAVVLLLPLVVPCYFVGLSFAKHEDSRPTLKSGIWLTLGCVAASVMVIVLTSMAVDLFRDQGGILKVTMLDGELFLGLFIALLVYTAVMALPFYVVTWLGYRHASPAAAKIDHLDTFK